MRFEGTARAHSLGKDGRWLDDNQWANLREQWAGGAWTKGRAWASVSRRSSPVAL